MNLTEFKKKLYGNMEYRYFYFFLSKNVFEVKKINNNKHIYIYIFMINTTVIIVNNNA